MSTKGTTATIVSIFGKNTKAKKAATKLVKSNTKPSTNTGRAYNIERITVHGIEVPVVNHETKGPMIAYRMLSEELGLNKTTLDNIVAKKDMKRSVYNLSTHLSYGTKGATRTQEVAFIPLRKFEVLINSVNTGHIGKTLNQKDRAELVEDIETLQEEIRSVIEAYYHDGVVINKKVKPTTKGKVALLKASVRHISPEEHSALNRRFLKEQKITKSMADATLLRAKSHVANSIKVAKKDGRSSYARRLNEMVEVFEEGKGYLADGNYHDAHECFMEVTDMTLDATMASRNYAKSELGALRRDVKDLKVRMIRLEDKIDARDDAIVNLQKMAISQQSTLASQQKSINGLVVSVGKIVEHLGLDAKK